MKALDRRKFLKLMGAAGLAAAVPWPLRLARAQLTEDPYTGPLFVTIAAAGGWDPTSFCDPKENVPGEREINHWSRTLQAGTIARSPLTYAPFANNQAFFSRFYRSMLVINGVDCQTNSHDTGVRFNWSGREDPGYPAFAAIAAAAYGDGLPLPYLTNSSFRETAGLATYTEVNSTRALQDLVDVNRVSGSDRVYHEEDERALVEAYQEARVVRQASRSGSLPREQAALTNLAFARASRDQLRALLVDLPDQLVNPVDRDGNNNPLLQQAQLALICFNAGLTVACDLEIGGFDTHGNHDTEHRSSLQRLTNGIEYLWDTAEAMGLAGRLHVLVSSDFGRTPWYNDGNGKDHWPIGSAILMKKNATWANRVIGLTDEGHNAIPIDPLTLAARPGAGGVVLGPGHVHDVFRRVAGLDRHAVALRYPLNVTPVNLFA
jgi:hypothetical protein